MSESIPLTQGKVTIVDFDDIERLSPYKWLYCNGYARHCYWDKKEKTYKWISLHRFIVNCPDDMYVDHINGDKLDNRKSNLRIVTKLQNNINVPKYKGKTSKFKGVNWHRTRKKWVANITSNRKQKHLGYFDNEIEAAKAYNKAASELFGEYAVLNKKEEVVL